MPIRDIEKNRIYQREWARKHRESQKEYFMKIRKQALEKLGNKCIYCGCDIPESLEFNHKNGGGCKEKKQHGSATKSLIFDIVAGRRTDIDLTCRVCNAVHYLEIVKKLGKHWKVIYIP